MSAMKKAMKQKENTQMPLKSAACCSESTMTKHHKASTTEPCYAAEVLSKTKGTKSTKTKVVAHIDCGFTNNLFIRGEGVSSLSWDKGIQMKNTGPNEWVWESDRPFSTMQFKVLVNDSWYEQGNNHSLGFGQNMDFSPQF
jgi:hypothetical protein